VHGALLRAVQLLLVVFHARSRTRTAASRCTHPSGFGVTA
jgi:hypothetical protein